MSKDAQKGAKEAVLTSFLRQLLNLGVKPEYTLSDKDWSEINAMHSVWPSAKHQLCFWHALRALKQRLAKNKDTPAAYDVDRARREFSFVKQGFVPFLQQPESKLVSHDRAAVKVYCLTVRRFHARQKSH